MTRNYREAYGLFACSSILFNPDLDIGETFGDMPEYLWLSPGLQQASGTNSGSSGREVRLGLPGKANQTMKHAPG